MQKTFYDSALEYAEKLVSIDFGETTPQLALWNFFSNEAKKIHKEIKNDKEFFIQINLLNNVWNVLSEKHFWIQKNFFLNFAIDRMETTSKTKK